MRALISHAIWAKMKTAKKVEVRVGELEMELSEETLMSFRLLMDYTQRRWVAMRRKHSRSRRRSTKSPRASDDVAEAG